MQFPKKGGPFGARVLADIGTGLGAGIAGLSRSLTINEQTVAPTFFYKASDLASASSNWVGEYGETLTAQGSGGTAGLYAPTPSDVDRAVRLAGTRYFAPASSTFADITSKDQVWELFIKTPALGGGTQYAAGKFDTRGTRLQFADAAGMRFLPVGASSSATVSTGILAPSTWYHVFLVYDENGSAIFYLDADAKSAVDVSGVGSLTNSALFALGALTGGANTYAGEIVHAALWVGDPGWLDTHLQATIAAERFHQLVGAYSPRYGVPTQSLLRNSVAMLERTKGGVQRRFTVGARWPRMEKRAGIAGFYGSGYKSEAQEQNICLQSEDLTTTWAKLAAGDTIGAGVESSEYDSNLNSIVGDATDTLHGVSQSVTLTAATWYIRGEAKRGDKDWLYVDVSTIANATAYFDLLNGVAGTVGAGATAKIRDLGDGKMQWEIAVTGTAAAHTLRVCAANADTDNDFAGDGATPNVYVGRISVSLVGGSYIKTTTAAVTRLADAPLDYRGVALPQRGTIAVDVLMPDRDLGALPLGGMNDGGSVNQRVEIYHDATADAPQAIVSQTTLQANVIGTTDISDGKWREVRIAFSTNDVRAYVDGVAEGTPDTSCNIPAELDRITVGGNYNGAPSGALVRMRLFSRPTTKKVTVFE